MNQGLKLLLSVLLLRERSPKADPINTSFNSLGICSKVTVLGFLFKERGIGLELLKYKLNQPAKTGNDNNNKIAVITTAQANKINFDPQTMNIYPKDLYSKENTKSIRQAIYINVLTLIWSYS